MYLLTIQNQTEALPDASTARDYLADAFLNLAGDEREDYRGYAENMADDALFSLRDCVEVFNDFWGDTHPASLSTFTPRRRA